MEEVDSIILHFLRQLNIGADLILQWVPSLVGLRSNEEAELLAKRATLERKHLDFVPNYSEVLPKFKNVCFQNIDEQIKNICDLPVEVIIESASKCLTTINPSVKVPAKLPSGISHRIEVAAQVASICKDLGYKNDVGYQTFLYYNEAELRQVFMFLIERLPSEGKQTLSTTTANTKSQLMQNISQKIAEDLNSMWIPPCCKPVQNTVGDFIQPSVTRPSPASRMTEEEIVQKLQKIQETNKSFVTPLPAQEITEFPIEREPRHDINKSLKDLKEMAIVLREKLNTLESERNMMNTEYTQAQKSCEKAEADLNNVQNILNSIGITDLESEGPTNNILEKVQKNINILHRKSEELTSKNLSLKVEIDKIKCSKALTESERVRCKKILVNLKETAKTMKEEYEKKEETKNQLKKSYEKLKGGNKRSIYTKRILEIISNVDKQNLEIQKILEDTRQLQKEINTLEGQLDRCFSIADETLFRDAKKDDQAKKAYKLLALLHSECNTIVSLVNDTGNLAREKVDLEDNIKTEKAKRTEDTLSKIQLDLARMQEESGVNNN